MIKGLINTLKTSPKLAFYESLRRILNRPYVYNGFAVTTTAEFKALRRALQLGYKLTREGRFYIIDVGWGRFYIPELNLATVLLYEDLTTMYDINVKNRDVLDIGAFIGDTPVWFYKRGARRVTAYEPVYYDICRRYMEVNNVTGECIGKGVWGWQGRVGVTLMGTLTGDRPGDFPIEVEDFAEVLSRGYDVAKLDCEGCEWWLLTAPCAVLKNVDIYIVEIRGPILPFMDKMRSCGYEGHVVKKLKEYVTVMRFNRD